MTFVCNKSHKYIGKCIAYRIQSQVSIYKCSSKSGNTNYITTSNIKKRFIQTENANKTLAFIVFCI